jgi:outer membrane protein assembly factor BamB
MRLFRSLNVTLSCVAALACAASHADTNWPAWRGPSATGVADGNPPATWSETENIKWKVAMPDDGDCTPIIWGDRIFIQTAIADAEDPGASPPADAGREILTRMPTVSYSFRVVCLDRTDGKTLWERTAAEGIPHEGHHPSSSFASYSPVTDGEFVWASFGSRGIHCYTMDGEHVWSQDLIEMLTFRGFGEGSSPALAGDAVVVVADHEGQSKIFAFDKRTGEQLWSHDREEGTSWATPLPVEVGGKLQVITSASNFVRSYDASTGEVVWKCAGLTRGAIPSPVIGHGNVYCMTGYDAFSLLSIRLGGTGDLSGSDAIVWTADHGTPYISSPLLHDDRIYTIENMRPFLSCFDAKTGQVIYDKERLEGIRQMYSSPVGAAGRIYIAGRDGNVLVVKHADAFEILATNKLDDGFDASPVIVGAELFLKGEKSLYCVSEKP